MPEMTEKMWRIAHVLAADLALNRVSKNMVQQAAEYLRGYPAASLSDYLSRLEKLGDAFAGGKSGRLERTDLRRALERADWPQDAHKSVLTLGWIARLVDYYAEHQAEAAQRSEIQFVALRPGQSLEGIARERDKKQKQMWVAVASGQWGVAPFHEAVDVGDRVRVVVRRVKSPISFEVELAGLPAAPPAPRGSQPQAARPSRKSSATPPPAEGDRISEAAQSFWEFFQQRGTEQEDENGE